MASERQQTRTFDSLFHPKHEGFAALALPALLSEVRNRSIKSNPKKIEILHWGKLYRLPAVSATQRNHPGQSSAAFVSLSVPLNIHRNRPILCSRPRRLPKFMSLTVFPSRPCTQPIASLIRKLKKISYARK